MLTIKYSSAGVPMWTRRYGTSDTGGAIAQAVAVDTSGNVFVTGYAVGILTIKYSGAGTPVWTNRYSGSEASALVVDAKGNVVVTGASYGERLDYLTLKYSSAGLPLWTNRYSGPAGRNDEPVAMVLDHCNNVIVTGRSYRDPDNYDLVTVKYVTVPPPAMTCLQLTNGAFQLRLENLLQPGNLVIESSDDLTAWQPIFTNTTPTNLLFYTDPEPATFQRRFYRARLE